MRLMTLTTGWIHDDVYGRMLRRMQAASAEERFANSAYHGIEDVYEQKTANNHTLVRHVVRRWVPPGQGIR